jgi:hypothetical protein
MPKDIRAAILAPCRDASTGAVDVASVLRHLLLFERYVIRSQRLAELPALVAALGVDGVSQLLNTGTLGIQAHAKSIGDVSRVKQLPLFVYEFDKVMAADPRKYDEDNLKKLEKLEGVGKHGSAKLISAVQRGIVRFPTTYLDETLTGSAFEIAANAPAMRRSLALVLQQTTRQEIAEARVSLTCHQEAKLRFRAISNVQEFGLEGEQAHQLVARAVMVVLRMNSQIEEMKILNALAAVNPEDESVLRERLAPLWESDSPARQNHRFARICELANVPSFEDAVRNGPVRFDAFMKLRGSSDCREFREWLRSVDDINDENLRRMVTSIRARAGNALNSFAGKAVRFVATTAIGMVPGVGLVLGPTASGLDSFLVDRVAPHSGPVAFLDALTPLLRG